MSDSTWYPREREAESLAAQLRTQRLTLLYGAPGAGKTTLLVSGVMPLLHRRATDGATVHDAGRGVVLPFPDRRNASRDAIYEPLRLSESGALVEAGLEGSAVPAGLPPDTEVAVFFDAWDEAPLEGLLAHMKDALKFPNFDGARRRRSLASTLGAYHRQRGGRTLLILDRFERFLAASPDAPGISVFSDAFVDAMNRPGLPVHFLIALDEDAAPLLERFRGRIAGIDDFCMRLPPLHRAMPAPYTASGANRPSVVSSLQPPGTVPVIPVLRQVPDGHPPVDMVLPTLGVEEAEAAAAAALRDAVATQPPPSPEHASTRRPEWVDQAFSHSTDHMKTEDVYASVEALLGKIVQGGKRPEEAPLAQPQQSQSQPLPQPPIHAQVHAPREPHVQPQPRVPTAGRAAQQPASPPVTPMPAAPATPTAAQARPTVSQPASAHAQPAHARPAAPKPAPVHAEPSAAARDAAAPEFGPIYTFETPHSDAPVESFANVGDAPSAWPNIAVEPALAEHRHDTRAAEATAGRARVHAGAEASGAATAAAPGVSPFITSSPASSPAASDWLAEVHASLNKLAQAENNAPPVDIEALAGEPLPIDDDERVGRGNRSLTMVVAFVVTAAALAVLVLFLLPPQWRPFEMPDLVGMVNNLMDAPQPPPTNMSP